VPRTGAVLIRFLVDLAAALRPPAGSLSSRVGKIACRIVAIVLWPCAILPTR